MLPVQIDALYRSGWSAIAISIASMALAAWAIAWMIQRTTGSIAAGAAAAAVLVLNPDVLYLQSTPMTEPLLFGTTFLAVALIARWLDDDPRRSARAPGWAVTAACLTRYEAWPITIAALALAFGVLLRRGWRPGDAILPVARLAAWPFFTAIAFAVNSKITVGSWFVDSGFFVPDNPALGHPLLAWHQVWDGLVRLTGSAVPWIAVAAAVAIVMTGARSRSRASLTLVVALAACAALPWAAYYRGHPVRLRYDVPLVAAAAAIAGAGIGLLPRAARGAAAVLTIAIAVWQAHPLDPNAPVIAESRRDAPNAIGRRAVTAYLVAHRDRTEIMMSMGSLAHYMHDLSFEGFVLRDFLHEGDGDIWTRALGHPRLFAGWIAIEEKAEGGDELYWRARHDPHFLEGFERVAEGGGVALYRRTPNPAPIRDAGFGIGSGIRDWIRDSGLDQGFGIGLGIRD